MEDGTWIRDWRCGFVSMEKTWSVELCFGRKGDADGGGVRVGVWSGALYEMRTRSLIGGCLDTEPEWRMA